MQRALITIQQLNSLNQEKMPTKKKEAEAAYGASGCSQENIIIKKCLTVSRCSVM